MAEDNVVAENNLSSWSVEPTTQLVHLDGLMERQKTITREASKVPSQINKEVSAAHANIVRDWERFISPNEFGPLMLVNKLVSPTLLEKPTVSGEQIKECSEALESVLTRLNPHRLVVILQGYDSFHQHGSHSVRYFMSHLVKNARKDHPEIMSHTRSLKKSRDFLQFYRELGPEEFVKYYKLTLDRNNRGAY